MTLKGPRVRLLSEENVATKLPTVDVDVVLRAVVIGGNVLAAAEGAKKTRRRVPRKQEKLIRAVADEGSADFDRLSETFEREWKAVLKRHRRSYILVPKSEFFRNIADLCGRVNAALLAGYREPEHRQDLVALVGGSFVGLAFDHQRYLVRWESSSELSALEQATQESTSRSHTPLKRKRGSEPEVEDRPAVRHEPAPEPMLEHRADPSVGIAEVKHFEEDRVTGRWRFELDGRRIEVDRTHGYLKVDGKLHTVTELRDLNSKDDLTGRALDAVRRCF